LRERGGGGGINKREDEREDESSYVRIVMVGGWVTAVSIC
jgi:hypothetical protein